MPKAKAKAKSSPVPEAAEKRRSVEIDGRKVEVVSIADLTFGEVEDLEDYFGFPMSQIPYEAGKTMLFLLFLTLRRDKAETSLDDVRAMKISDVAWIEEDVEEDPKAAADGDGAEDASEPEISGPRSSPTSTD